MKIRTKIENNNGGRVHKNPSFPATSELTLSRFIAPIITKTVPINEKANFFCLSIKIPAGIPNPILTSNTKKKAKLM